MLTRKEGDKKFSMNQNFTLLFVFRRTLRIIMDAKRCHRSQWNQPFEIESHCTNLVKQTRCHCENVDIGLTRSNSFHLLWTEERRNAEVLLTNARVYTIAQILTAMLDHRKGFWVADHRQQTHPVHQLFPCQPDAVPSGTKSNPQNS